MEPELKQRLSELVSIFLEENQKLNLSAFRTEEDCWVGNVLDSIAVLDLPIFTEGSTILDIGTGGGFPLLALAICLPQCQLTGVDATQKKVDAVQRMIDALEISNVSLVSGRAEELGRDPAHREQYDIVLSRAVASTNVLLEYCAPFAKPAGHVILWKSLKIEQELQDALLARAELSCQLTNQHEYELPEKWGKRQLLIFEKRHKTSEKYPRNIGVPKKNPLL